MNVAIRCDASHVIGTGHVMRCLTLADQLRDKGADVKFICRDHSGNMNSYIEEHGYEVHRLPLNQAPDDSYDDEYARWLVVSTEKDVQETVAWLREQKSTVDWVIVDHYGLDERWGRAVRPSVGHIMVIDDLANRAHDCDLLLDQGLYPHQPQRYPELVPLTCRVLLGPEYALLRREFIRVREGLRERDGVVRRILLFFGGVDPTNETAKAIEALKRLGRNDLLVDVVVGGGNQNHESIRRRCREQPGMSYHRNVDSMAEMMTRADLAVGGGGGTTWERCYLGLPSIALIIAENQRAMIEALATQGALISAGWHADLTVKDLTELITWVLERPRLLKEMGQSALRVMGDAGTHSNHPAAETIMELGNALR